MTEQIGSQFRSKLFAWKIGYNGERRCIYMPALTIVGHIELMVDGIGDPLRIIALTAVAIKPFNAVDEQFAVEYGNGDRTLAF